jgi:hypothetical protein
MIWTAESKRLYHESLDPEGNCPLGPQERWALVTDMPESKEHTRLVGLQGPFFLRMDALIKEMFATPALTAEGRRAKATVLLGCILTDDWRRVDAETEYPERMARDLLIEFIGGEPGEMLRSVRLRDAENRKIEASDQTRRPCAAIYAGGFRLGLAHVPVAGWYPRPRSPRVIVSPLVIVPSAKSGASRELSGRPAKVGYCVENARLWMRM